MRISVKAVVGLATLAIGSALLAGCGTATTSASEAAAAPSDTTAAGQSDELFVLRLTMNSQQSAQMVHNVANQLEPKVGTELADPLRRWSEHVTAESNTLLQQWQVSMVGMDHSRYRFLIEDSQLRDLSNLRGSAAAKLWLDLQIRVNQNTIELARAQIDSGRTGPATELATEVLASATQFQTELEKVRVSLG